MRLAFHLAALLTCVASGAHAQKPSITLEDAWARATVPSVKTGAVYVTIRDTGAPDRLIAASTTIASATELHETIQDGTVMKMRPVPALAISANAPVTLSPGGYHIMLIGLSRPLSVGETFPISLRFENAGVIETTVTVRGTSAGGTMPMGGAHDMPGHAPMKP